MHIFLSSNFKENMKTKCLNETTSAGVRCLSDLRNIKHKPIAKQTRVSEDSQDNNIYNIKIISELHKLNWNY